MNLNGEFNKRAQMTIFVIIAIVVVAGILAFVLIKSNISGGISKNLEPVYSYYDSCITEKAREAIDIAGSQGGYVTPPDYASGSEYAPSSSQLNFLGFPVPYWYYVSGNGLIKEQVPSKTEIEKQIAEYIADKISECSYDSFYSQGYSIEFSEPQITVKINDGFISVADKSNLKVSKGEETASVTNHNVEVTSSFGALYSDAVRIYNLEKSDAFLEEYGVDILRLYAPVDGVEAQCSAKMWKTQDVITNLMDGLEANIAAIKFKGSEEGADKYFVINQKISSEVNLMYSRYWPTKAAIYGDNVNEAVMVAEPIGNQEGMGVMGFCYIPYHFVYDLMYPVLIQLSKNDEVFQFPIVAVIEKNLPREAEFGNSDSLFDNNTGDVDLCGYNTQPVQINVYNVGLNKINANLSYQCLNQNCLIGEARGGTFMGDIPACVNGYIDVKANGYSEKKQIFSSNSETAADIILDREYDVRINVSLEGAPLKGSALVVFGNNDSGKTISTMVPDGDKIKLSEGTYWIKVYAYGNSSITIPEATKRECMQVSTGGIGALFGATEEKCIDVTIPAAKIENGLVGGGSTGTYLLAGDLQKGEIKLIAQKLPAPATLEQLQYNFELFDNLNLDIDFR